MAFINYIANEQIPLEHRVPDQDHILRIHGIHSKIMKQHYEWFVEMMFKKGPLSRKQREMIAVIVSVENKCHY